TDIAAGAKAPQLIVTASDLARRGSAEIYLPSQSARTPAAIRYAVSLPWRPWHRHRAWWRDARTREAVPPSARLPTQPGTANANSAGESPEPNPGRAQ